MINGINQMTFGQLKRELRRFWYEVNMLGVYNVKDPNFKLRSKFNKTDIRRYLTQDQTKQLYKELRNYFCNGSLIKIQTLCLMLNILGEDLCYYVYGVFKRVKVASPYLGTPKVKPALKVAGNYPDPVKLDPANYKRPVFVTWNRVYIGEKIYD